MTECSPRQSLRVSYRCVALALTLLLTFGSVTPAQAQGYGGGYGGEYYRGGNTTFGDFGGYDYFPGNNYDGPLVEANIEGGGGIDLGCGAINIMDYMKATFNVNNLIERAKASMQTMVAKYVMVFLLSQPIIASAMDKLNGMLNFGYDMFNQSCDLNEVQKLAKARYTRECIADGGNPVSCQQMEDPMKPLMNKAASVLGEDLQRVLSDPVGSLQATMGCTPGAIKDNGAADSDACILMAFAPRPCGHMDFGTSGMFGNSGQRVLTGCSSTPAPVSGAGVAGYTVKATATVINKFNDVWDEIRRANPLSTVADLKIIASLAVEKANAEEKAVAALPPSAKKGNTLALTNVSYATSMFGKGGSEASQKMIDEYVQSDLGLKGCSEANRTNSLRMAKHIADAANEYYSKNGGKTITVSTELSDADKVDFNKYFNLDKIPEESRKAMGIDAESAAVLMEGTFNCLATGKAGIGGEGVNLIDPHTQVAIATGTPIFFRGDMRVVDWQTYATSVAKPLSCKEVSKVFGFIIGKLKFAKEQLKMSSEVVLTGANKVGEDGTVSQLPSKTAKTEETAKYLEPGLQQAIDALQATFDANERDCKGSPSSGLSI